MKIIARFCIFILLVVAVAMAEDIHKEYSIQPNKKLTMNIESGGSITVTGWEKDSIAVDVYLRDRDSERFRVTIEETSSGLEVRSRERGRDNGHRRSPEFDIHLPKKFNLDLESAGGAITISGVDGEMEGQTMGGELRLTNLRGTVNLHTMGGAISLTKSDVDGEVTKNGGRDLIEDVTGNVSGRSMGGAVTYKNVTGRNGKSTGDEVRVSTMGGPIDVDDAPAGADVHTMGGNITIHSASDHVKAVTMGGDVQIDKVNGWVDASTMSGDVEVTMVGDPSKGKRDVKLSSMSGDVRLAVPEHLSMDVDITLAYTRDHRKGQIHSDFPLDEKTSKEWEYEHGSPRKYIRANGAVNGGAHRISISTINGDVYLLKQR